MLKKNYKECDKSKQGIRGITTDKRKKTEREKYQGGYGNLWNMDIYVI
jgi:hypothetical protein